MKTMNRNHVSRIDRHSQQGLSLVELMVAIVLGLILSAGVIQLFVGSKQTYRFHDAQSRVQENARFAIEELNRDIRMAGFVGCIANVPSINNTLNGSPPPFTVGNAIRGWEAAGTGPSDTFNLPGINTAVVNAAGGGWSSAGGAALPAGIMSLPGSDILEIWRGMDNPISLNQVTPGANTVLRMTFNGIVQEDDILLISDCRSADWVQACSVGTTTAGGVKSTQAQLSNGCSPGNNVSLPVLTQAGGEIVRVRGFIYFVGKRDNDANNPPGLFRVPLGDGLVIAAGAAEEIVEGVESMQLLYGVDTNNDRQVDEYQTGDAVGNWGNVLSTRLALLMRSTERGDDISGAVTHSLAGSTASAAADGRLRQVYNSTVTIRNRVP